MLHCGSGERSDTRREEKHDTHFGKGSEDEGGEEGTKTDAKTHQKGGIYLSGTLDTRYPIW